MNELLKGSFSLQILRDIGSISFLSHALSKQAFPVSGASFWNRLPPHVISAPSLAIFRQRLKTFLFHRTWSSDLLTGTALFVIIDVI